MWLIAYPSVSSISKKMESEWSSNSFVSMMNKAAGQEIKPRCNCTALILCCNLLSKLDHDIAITRFMCQPGVLANQRDLMVPCGDVMQRGNA